MCQAPLSSTISRILLKFMSIELVMLSKHLILYHPPLLLPSIFPSITVFSNELGLCIRLPKYWSFNFSNSPSNKYSGLISSTPGHSVVKKIHLPMQEMLVPSLGQEDPLEKKWQPTTVSLPGKSHGQKSRAWWTTGHGVTKRVRQFSN